MKKPMQNQEYHLPDKQSESQTVRGTGCRWRKDRTGLRDGTGGPRRSFGSVVCCLKLVPSRLARRPLLERSLGGLAGMAGCKVQHVNALSHCPTPPKLSELSNFQTAPEQISQDSRAMACELSIFMPATAIIEQLPESCLLEVMTAR